jgi:hypothetical protein
MPLLVSLAIFLALCATTRGRAAQPRRRIAFAVFAFVGFGLGLAACGGGAGVTDPPAAAVAGPQPIAAGSYILSVTLSDSAQTASLRLQLNVKSQ